MMLLPHWGKGITIIITPTEQVKPTSLINV
nr:MAG TPA: hypothetical protein [Caudoviricetes sp.]